MYSQIDSNKRKSAFLIVCSFFFVIVVSQAISYVYGYGPEFLIIALLFAVISNLIAYYNGDAIALKMNRARPITGKDNPYVYRMVENLCITAGTPKPRVYLIDDAGMNAFATGRNPGHASIALTTGIINGLENEELEGVIAHELSHIKNYDIRLMTITAIMVGTIMVLIDFGWRMGAGRKSEKMHPAFALVGLALIIFAPLIGQIIQLAISRKREFLADASGALLTRYPEGLARALEKISGESATISRVNHATAHLFIANPFGAKAESLLNKFFSTHPPIAERVAALRQMA